MLADRCARMMKLTCAFRDGADAPNDVVSRTKVHILLIEVPH